MTNDINDLKATLLLAVERAEQASADATLAAKNAERAAKHANKAAEKVKKAKAKVKESEKEISIMRDKAEETNIKYQEDIIDIITKAKKKKKALKKIAKLNDEKLK
jgi:methyl-accepting chemotaxis protein